MTHKQAAEAAVEQIEAGLAQLTALMSDPASLDFDAVAGSLEKFEEVMAAKGLIDAAFAWLADRTDAGRLVGSVRTLPEGSAPTPQDRCLPLQPATAPSTTAASRTRGNPGGAGRP